MTSMEPKKRTPILLWSAVEKLAALRTLTNTMFLWEDGPVTQYETRAQDANNLAIAVVNSAKESQRSLFDALEKTHGVPRRAICCSAVHELVLAYPPQKLIPSTLFSSQGLVSFRSSLCNPMWLLNLQLKRGFQRPNYAFCEYRTQKLRGINTRL